MEVIFSEHAKFEMKRRQISEKFVVITVYKTSKIEKYWKEERVE